MSSAPTASGGGVLGGRALRDTWGCHAVGGQAAAATGWASGAQCGTVEAALWLWHGNVGDVARARQGPASALPPSPASVGGQERRAQRPQRQPASATACEQPPGLQPSKPAVHAPPPSHRPPSAARPRPRCLTSPSGCPRPASPSPAPPPPGHIGSGSEHVAADRALADPRHAACPLAPSPSQTAAQLVRRHRTPELDRHGLAVALGHERQRCQRRR